MVLADQQGPENAAYLITKPELLDLEIPVTRAQTLRSTKLHVAQQHGTAEPASPGLPGNTPQGHRNLPADKD